MGSGLSFTLTSPCLVDSTGMSPTESACLQRGYLDRSLSGLGSVPQTTALVKLVAELDP